MDAIRRPLLAVGARPAREYLMALGCGTGEGHIAKAVARISRDNERHHASALPFEFGAWPVRPLPNGKAEVTAEVQADWWTTDDHGRIGGYGSSPPTWV